MNNVLIVDDHCLTRRGIAYLLSTIPEIQVVGEAESGEEALRLMRTLDLDLAVLDIILPGIDGIETMEAMKRLNPRLKVVFLSVYDDDRLTLRCYRAGADAFINKGEPEGAFRNAILAALSGKRYASPRITEMLLDFVTEERRPTSRLGDREMQVLLLTGTGLSPTQIAGRLSISIKTVSTYRARIKRKLGLGSSTEMVRYVLENGLLPRVG